MSTKPKGYTPVSADQFHVRQSGAKVLITAPCGQTFGFTITEIDKLVVQVAEASSQALEAKIRRREEEERRAKESKEIIFPDIEEARRGYHGLQWIMDDESMFAALHRKP